MNKLKFIWAALWLFLLAFAIPSSSFGWPWSDKKAEAEAVVQKALADWPFIAKYVDRLPSDMKMEEEMKWLQLNNQALAEAIGLAKSDSSRSQLTLGLQQAQAEIDQLNKLQEAIQAVQANPASTSAQKQLIQIVRLKRAAQSPPSE